MKFAALAIGFMTAAGLFAASCPQTAPPAQAWDPSGNALLSGTYYFRYVQYSVGPQGNLGRAVTLYGNITFSGMGTYSIAKAVAIDSNSAVLVSGEVPLPQGTYSISGSYSISASGLGFLSNPLCPGDQVWGLASQVPPVAGQSASFIGSSTESLSGYNDLFVAVPTSASLSQSSLSGTYVINYLNFPDGYVKDALAATFQMTANGASPPNAGALQFTSPMKNIGAGAVAAGMPNVSYSFQNAAFVLNFPAGGTIIPGQEDLFMSPDGSFVFGGAPGAWDMFVGVKTGPGVSNFQGLYYQAGIDEDLANINASTPSAAMATYYGAIDVLQGPSVVFDHQRVLTSPNSNLAVANSPCALGLSCAIGKTFTEPLGLTFTPFGTNSPTPVPTYAEGTTAYTVAAGGTARIGFGTGSKLGISVALPGTPVVPAPAGSACTTCISVTGILNAASYMPFTAGVSPGELIVLFGSGFPPLAQAAGPNASLSGVQVLINKIPADITYVSPTQIGAVVPATISGPFAQIQVINGSTISNTVWEPVNFTTPGVFTQTANGLHDAIATQPNYFLISPSNAAQPGAPVTLWVTGLGNEGYVLQNGQFVFQPNVFTATVGGAPAPISFAGPVPAFPGLYQINLTLPASFPGMTVPGELPMVISGPDSLNIQSTIYVQ